MPLHLTLASAPDAALPLQLTLPRPLLDQQLQRPWPAPSSAPASALGTLAHGPLTLHALGSQVQALIPRLHSGPPQRLPVQACRGPATQRAWHDAPSGLALLYRSAHGEACPATPAAWDVWLARSAPEHRLACAALVPDIAVLWLQPDGSLHAWLRTGDAWAALQGQPGARSAWHPVAHVALPGAGMLDSRRDAAEPLPDDTPLRHSRLGAALGAPVLSRLQRSRWMVVGCDTVGSLLAHSLARMGVNLQLLDPAPMSASSLLADLPPLHEGQPKPVALQHQLRGLLRPGARCDARALSVASPAAGSLLAGADGLLCCTTDPQARRWANAWSQALLKPLLAVRTQAGPQGFDAELQLVLPGAGCLVCGAGGPDPAAPLHSAHQASARSWQGVAAHAALRLLEHLYAGRVAVPLRRRLSETPDGGLQVLDHDVRAAARMDCPVCHTLVGAGPAAVQATMNATATRRAA
ncbi:ThiF family adenylyltransferase [Ideonella sp. 4Y16]|uniref:ThiF family adenylyltransferase n=1 Tax=Ideonella alba TaxID=2824118 RepID=UPI001B38DAF6|nr:ThiF family adenylyltransferase [Ideonella alba]MBQ0942233.1 ThiF family adenylyltransferase [Ideonella alba]